ncbi:hypothetical protein [Parvibium lacunae]|uniref:Gfo/Idh/MocA-like oxidoreductase N-terminal domain-containing protein n=1 Tax=Parvibium lacunae TaxID=1888893 RepID=A0A368L2U2_9BURK|nr:hypothetical protein [Parvibium lacunae]RCS57428.1 hypothetical protein DU000_08165 [Parvibium lacunae]
MYQIAVIGAGQLGSRHLQGLARLELDCQYFVVDPSESSLVTTKNRLNEIDIPEIDKKVTYLRSINDLPKIIDYAVISTSADVRLKVIKDLLNLVDVKNLLLEKVLFQHSDDYQVASMLFKEKKDLKIWVNCPRRLFPIYKKVHSFFKEDPIHHFQVYGGNWGLGCNSIHFIDLLAFFTGKPPSDLCTMSLDTHITASKREGFYEFTGSLRGKSGGTLFDLTSLASSNSKLLITLRSEKRTCLIDERSGQAFFNIDDSTSSWTSEAFRNPLVSDQSTLIAKNILINGESELASFTDSVAYHLPLIRCLGKHSSKLLGNDPDFCPIT